jgi:hypothetical protein
VTRLRHNLLLLLAVLLLVSPALVLSPFFVPNDPPPMPKTPATPNFEGATVSICQPHAVLGATGWVSYVDARGGETIPAYCEEK